MQVNGLILHDNDYIIVNKKKFHIKYEEYEDCVETTLFSVFVNSYPTPEIVSGLMKVLTSKHRVLPDGSLKALKSEMRFEGEWDYYFNRSQ